MKRLFISFNSSKCAGCFACVVGCQEKQNHVIGSVSFRQVITRELEISQSIMLKSLSIACRNCKDAHCLNECPSGAIFRQAETGIVDVNRDLCIVCQNCKSACPFDIPRFDADGKMIKCNLCQDHIVIDKLPACVAVCPTKSLTLHST